MARGFESKQVESQQEEATRPRSTGRRLSEEEIERLERARTLQLSRTRLLADLKTATNTHHRHMLEQALVAIEDQIQALGELPH